MKIFYMVVLAFCMVSIVETRANPAVKQVAQDDKNVAKKGQNNNTVRSNRTDDKAPAESSGQNPNAESATKKGYDYYKAQSEINSAGSKGKARDYNSSRSNKTAGSVAPNPSDSENDSVSSVKKGNHNSTRSNRTTNQEPEKK